MLTSLAACHGMSSSSDLIPISTVPSFPLIGFTHGAKLLEAERMCMK